MLRIFLWSVICCIAPLGYGAAAQELSQAVRGWWITCDYRGDCVAETRATTDENDALTLRLSRTRDAESAVLVSISAEARLLPGMRVTLEGQEMGRRSFETVGQEGSDKALGFEVNARDPLIGSFRTEGSLLIRFGFGEVEIEQPFRANLSGVTDVLLVMDVVQLRIGRSDAAVAWGSNAPDSVSEVELPRIVLPATVAAEGFGESGSGEAGTKVVYRTLELPQEVVDQGRQLFDCQLNDAIEAFGAVVTQDKTGLQAYLVACQTGDVNIAHYVVFHAPASGLVWRVMAFGSPPDSGEPQRSIVINPVWSPETNLMTFTSYDGPSADCGSHEVHRFRPYDASFELVEFRRKRDCDGKTDNPADYPVEWSLDGDDRADN